MSKYEKKKRVFFKCEDQQNASPSSNLSLVCKSSGQQALANKA